MEEDGAPELQSRTTEGINIAKRKIRLNLESIKLDDRAQPRTERSTELVAEYIEAMKNREKFPALVVFHDGEEYWLADGFHRYWAAVGSKQTAFDCDVHDGGLREAILYSVSANAKHGYRRSNEDKRRAVLTILENKEVRIDLQTGKPWSNREIARLCAVDESLVRKLRNVRPDPSAGEPQIDEVVAVKRDPSAGEPQIDEVVAVKRGGKVFTQSKGRRGGAVMLNDVPPAIKQEQAPGFEAHEPETPASKTDPAAYALPRSSKVPDALQQIKTVFEQLPPPSDVARDFPSALTAAEATEIADWFCAFSNSLEEGVAQSEIEVNPEARPITGNEGATASLPEARRPEVAEGRDLRQDGVYE